ncbi:acyltransferase [Microbacterium sp. M28]|uniref:acyltransferase n=1 Tax=Microbacterium sp. M28 TaxID=2962064 RepID=UPI0021F3D73A|nr:acyltransferase [Microbacterium sp. M28]UYO98171.1 acyltransferase [Microbacterium sp. M28]
MTAAGRHLYLDVLRVVAVCGVVSIHVFGGLMTNEARRGELGWWGALIFDAGNVWVVPMFVMVSGALLLSPRAHAEGPAAFYRRRLLRLGPAFIFWQLFYILVARMAISGQQLSVGGVIALFADGTTYTHLYFLWLIVGLYAVAPVLAPFLAQGGRSRAVVMAAVVMALTIATYTSASLLTWAGHPRSVVLTAFTQWVPYVGFFVAGIALHGVVLSGGRRAIAVIGSLAAIAAVVLEAGLAAPGSFLRALIPLGYPTLLTSIAVVCLFLAVQSLLSGVRTSNRVLAVVRALSDASFGVFLVHFVLMLLMRLLWPALAEAQSSSFLVAFFMLVVLLIASFAISLVARRIPYLRRLF